MLKPVGSLLFSATATGSSCAYCVLHTRCVTLCLSLTFADERTIVMAKTYIPSAVDVANHAHRYLTRYQAKLSAGATTDQILALTDLVACLATFLQKWFKPTPIT